MSKLEQGDFNKICRMCLKEDSTLINIFFSDAVSFISEITSIVLKEGDFLPENICIPCMDKSTEFYNFKQLCENSNITLHTILTLGGEIDSRLYNTDDNAIVKIEDADNQKESNFKSETTYYKSSKPPASKPDQHADMQDSIHSKNQITGDNLSVNVPLKRCPSRKIEIKRSYKDLIPLETYNNIKKSAETQCSNTTDRIQNYEAFSQTSITDQGSADDVELENDENGNEDISEIKEETELEELKSEDETGRVRCEYCLTEFYYIQRHLEEYHPSGGSHYCYVCPKGASSAYKTVKQFQAHLNYHKQLPKFQCEQCGKWFRYKHQKLVHMRLHTGERPAMCDICDKSFRDPRYLVIHLKSHTGERPYKCSICQKGFGHKFSLKVHMKTHSSEREHMCNICGKTFIYGHNLKIHLRQHTGEKPYVCRLCFTSFISCSVLKAHMLTHSDQKRFECKECGKRFKRTGDLNVHMRSHTGEKPYPCTLCSNRYKMSSHLTEHMKTHTGEKNYLCEICSKSFYNNKSLQVHKKTHTGEKTYNCPDCEKSFVHHTSLCAHQRRQHRQ